MTCGVIVYRVCKRRDKKTTGSHKGGGNTWRSFPTHCPGRNAAVLPFPRPWLVPESFIAAGVVGEWVEGRALVDVHVFL